MPDSCITRGGCIAAYSPELAHKTFRYSIQYLTLLFALLLIDHYGAYIREALQSAWV